MASDIWQPKISAYVDAELSDQEMHAMDAHLRDCPSCAVEVLHQVQLKQSAKLAARRYTPSPQFRRKIAVQVSAHKPATWRWGWISAFALAATVLIVVAGVLLNRSSDQARQKAQSQQLLAELTDIHVANLAASTPVDVVSSDRHTVKPWFQGKVPFSFNLPELAGSPFTLVGGRLTYLDHEPGAQLIYNVGSHHISVFIFREQPELARTFPVEASSQDLLNFRVESWSANELRYFVVGDAGEQSLQELSRMLRAAHS
jgi:anti-sigma factor RsiW